VSRLDKQVVGRLTIATVVALLSESAAFAQVGVPSRMERLESLLPFTTYRLQVRSSGVLHTVSWEDRFPHTEEASRLLKLFDLIKGIVNDRPEVKRLPVSRSGCL